MSGLAVYSEGEIQNAIDSLRGGVEARFDFPLTKDLSPLDSYDPSIESLANSTLVEECKRICDRLTSREK
jgi:hypothetical protein